MSRVYEDAMHRVEVPEKSDTFDPAQMVEAFERMADDWPSPEIFLPKLKDLITDLLLERGYPTPDAVVFYRGRDFRDFVAGEEPEPGERITLGWKFVCQFSKPLTVEREAADLYSKISEVESALDGGDVELVFAHSFMMGAAFERFKLRRLHLASVARGQKVKIGAKTAGAISKAKHRPLRQRRHARMSELVPEQGVDKAAVQCEIEGLGNWETIKRQWNRHK